MGGQAIQVKRLMEALRGRPEVDVRFTAMNPRLPGPLRTLQRVKFIRTIVTSAWYVATLPGAIWRADVLHVFSPAYWAYLLGPLPAMLIGRLLRRAVVLNYHSGEADDHLQRWPRSAETMRFLADAVAVPSGYLHQVFKRRAFDPVVISNIVPARDCQYRRREGFSPRVLSNRNLEPMYDVGTVVEAFALIQRKHPAATLTIAGDGSERSALEAKVSALQLRGVRFVGRTEPYAMTELYDQADLYLNASLIDNQPLSLIEAMLSGVPVVSTRSGGIPWVVRHDETGLLVEPGDAHALAAGALALLDDPARAARLADAAREESCGHYSAEVVAPSWVLLYQRLCSPQRAMRRRSVSLA
jgi:glycosyltransferase involved in cell wall biosynthesis